MMRFVPLTKVDAVKDCLHCPLYDQVLSSNTMEKIHLCIDEHNPKISHSKADLYVWFNELCTFKSM